MSFDILHIVSIVFKVVIDLIVLAVAFLLEAFGHWF